VIEIVTVCRNKVDLVPDAEAVRQEARTAPIDVEVYQDVDLDIDESAKTSSATATVADTIQKDIDDDDEYIREDADVYAEASPVPAPAAPIVAAKSASNVNIRIIAASTKTGAGLDDLAAAIIAAATTTLQGVDLVIPYAEDKGTIAAIQSVGVIQEMSYTDTATILSAQVPAAMMPRLKAFLRKEG
jgi:hypothetical protein